MMNKGRCLRIIAAVFVVAFICGCGGQTAVDHGGSLVSEQGQIAFTRATKFTSSDLESEDYTINVDGSGERRLTDSPGLNAFPSWSPDGERIVFATDRDGNWELYTMDADGSGQRRLTNTPADEAVPAWSPEGEKIAYVTDVLENPAIHVMNADGSGHKHLVDGNWPSWSPDGERIAYTTYSSGERLAVMYADGSGQRRLDESLVRRITGTAEAYEAAWSPNGKRIAYVANQGMNNEEIYVMKSDGTERRRLTDIPGYDHWPPTWSPDGTRIAFTSDGTKDNAEIYVMNSDGSGLTKLTNDPAYDSFPAWRP
jgi:Tol biopolymer transport system component